MSQNTANTFENWKKDLKYLTKENFNSLLTELWVDLKAVPHMVSMDWVDIHLLPRDVNELENHKWQYILGPYDSGVPLQCADCQLMLSCQKEGSKPWSVFIKTRYSESFDCLSRQMDKACT